MAHVADYKKQIVEKLVHQLLSSPIIGAVNMENLPAPPLQKMRAQLRGKVDFAMTKRRFMKIAIARAKEKRKGIEDLEKYLKGMPALIFTTENPFRLYRILDKNKSPAPAKAGQIAPRDIIVPAGPTPFAPGPIIGELGQIGIKTGVEGGKVSIKQDSIVAREGEKIKPKVAELLTRLDIKPMEVGLDLMAVYEDGVIYAKNILAIDDVKFMADLQSLARGSFNVAMFIGYATKDTIKPLLAKAHREARAVGLSENIIDEGIIEELIGKAERQMLGLKSTANIQVSPKSERKTAPEASKAEAPRKETKKEKPHVPKPAEQVIEPEKEIPAPEKKEALPAPEEMKELVAPEEVKELPVPPKKEEPKDTDAKIREMVEKTKKFSAHKEPTADDLLREVGASEPRTNERPAMPKKSTPAGKMPARRPEEHIPTVQELTEKKKQPSSKTEQQEAEDLFKELQKKGTLRK